jgi:HD-like signal output (HDOD) protein
MKKKIVFVDDEPNILDGLRRMLRPLRYEFEMLFALSGREALALIDHEKVDVVVSDMRMPGMDGARLLEIVKNEHPHTIRIMLTGQAEVNAILRTVGVVHQFLAKPCDPARLKMILLQASALQDILADGALKDLVSQIGSLPSPPELYTRLQKAIVSPEVEITDVGAIIEQDIAMSAKILQLVNSAFFGVYAKVDSPSRAVKLLGLETVKALVLCVEIFSQMKIQPDTLPVDDLWVHSMAVGKIAKAIADHEGADNETSGNAFLAGSLHDIGKLILASHLPLQYRQAATAARDQGIPMWVAEKAVFGASHSSVGAYLLGLWGFAGPVVEAICFHHHLEHYPASSFTAAHAVHIANVLYHREQPSPRGTGHGEELDMTALARLSPCDHCEKWQEICAAIVNNDNKTMS